MVNGLTMGIEAWLALAAWILVLGVVVWLLVREPDRRNARDEALDILRARFARGEITRDEFEAARRLVDSRPGPQGRMP